MSTHAVKTMLKALLLAVMLAVASAARSFPAAERQQHRALLEYEDAAEEDASTELGNSNEAVELESHSTADEVRVASSPAPPPTPPACVCL